MRSILILTSLSLNLMASSLAADIWAPEGDDNQEHPKPVLTIVSPGEGSRFLPIDKLVLNVPTKIFDRLDLLSKTPKRMTLGTELFGLKVGALVEDQDSDERPIFGADYIVLGFRCDSFLQRHRVQSVLNQAEYLDEYDGFYQYTDDSHSLLVFQFIDLSNNYHRQMGAIDFDESRCYSVSVNTYGTKKQGFSREEIESAMDFFLSPAWNSLNHIKTEIAKESNHDNHTN